MFEQRSTLDISKEQHYSQKDSRNKHHWIMKHEYWHIIHDCMFYIAVIVWWGATAGQLQGPVGKHHVTKFMWGQDQSLDSNTYPACLYCSDSWTVQLMAPWNGSFQKARFAGHENSESMQALQYKSWHSIGLAIKESSIIMARSIRYKIMYLLSFLAAV